MNERRTPHSIRIYYGMMVRKTLAILPRFVLMLLMMAGLVLGAGGLMSASRGTASLLPKINVAVVLDPGDLTTGMTARMVQQMDSINSLCNFLYLTPEEAEEGLRKDTVQASVYLPKNLYDDINTGINTPIVIRVSKGSGLGMLMFQDLVSTGLSLLQTGEATVYALSDAGHSYEMVMDLQESMDALAGQFLVLALRRNSLWKSELLSPYGEITSRDFYLITGLLGFLCLLFGSCFAGLYSHQEQVTDRCLSRIGVKSWHRGLARVLPMTILVNLCLVLLCGAVSLVPGLLTFRPALLWELLPLAFSLACFNHAVYALAFGASGSLVYVLTTTLLFVLGGGLFPSVYLPGWLARGAAFLPLHRWQAYLTEVLFHAGSSVSFAWILFWGVLLLNLGNVGLRIHER